MTIHVGAKNQVTLPKAVMKKAHLSMGDPLEVVCEDNAIVLKPLMHIPRDQAYFWTKEWQAGELEAEEDIRKGRTSGPFRTVKEMKQFFKKHAR